MHKHGPSCVILCPFNSPILFFILFDNLFCCIHGCCIVLLWAPSSFFCKFVSLFISWDVCVAWNPWRSDIDGVIYDDIANIPWLFPDCHVYEVLISKCLQDWLGIRVNDNVVSNFTFSVKIFDLWWKDASVALLQPLSCRCGLHKNQRILQVRGWGIAHELHIQIS